MGEDRRGLGEEEDPRVRQQQDALAVATVSALTIVSRGESQTHALTYSLRCAFFFLSRRSLSASADDNPFLSRPFVCCHGRIVASSRYISQLTDVDDITGARDD